MRKNNPELTDEELTIRFTNFVEELTNISRKHKVAISAVGGLHIAYTKNDKDYDELTYSDDYTSGDLYVKFPSDERGPY